MAKQLITDELWAVIEPLLPPEPEKRRGGLGIGSLVGAVDDARTDTFQTVGKIGSGLSEDNWIKLRKLLDEARVEEEPARVESRLTPDVWVEPRRVVAVLADEITRSPAHTAGRDENGRGLALRFPRVVGFVRGDKSAEDATTTEEIEEMFGQQRGSKSRRQNDDGSLSA